MDIKKTELLISIVKKEIHQEFPVDPGPASNRKQIKTNSSIDKTLDVTISD